MKICSIHVVSNGPIKPPGVHSQCLTPTLPQTSQYRIARPHPRPRQRAGPPTSPPKPTHPDQHPCTHHIAASRGKRTLVLTLAAARGHTFAGYALYARYGTDTLRDGAGRAGPSNSTGGGSEDGAGCTGRGAEYAAREGPAAAKRTCVLGSRGRSGASKMSW